MAKRKKNSKPRLGRSPVPPPSRPMEKDKYDRDAARRESEREIEESTREDQADEE